ncbi:unnamed protein product [Leptidea sinapis]|uniref:Uncharacterized protein n=3 Tax=Leptidea sinapis TaxID=189913 RepID=A0A5E4QWC0_9NEOP|nr:unnamed protein product [Leptidea sinapis]
MDMAKYSIEEKYRSYGMYPDPTRSYLDSATLSKAYMYMDQQQQRYPMDISKMYSEASAAAIAGLSSSVNPSISPRSTDSPDTKNDRPEGSSSTGSNPSPSLPYYQNSSLLMPQYPGQYPQTTQNGAEYRRPLTVIF